MTPDDAELRRLDALLRAVEFQPRESLGAEVAGRLRRALPEGADHSSRVSRLRRVLGLTGIGALIVWGLAWNTARQHAASRTVDRCCQDLDGGGDADDGLVIVPAAGKTVDRLAIYEDRDGSHSFTTGDSLRFERRGAPTMVGSLGPGPMTREYCCLDYDGEGESDDALLVIGLPPNQITLAAIYEHSTGPAVLR